MRYWKVEAKCGHVRRNRYVNKSFYVCAKSGSEAAKLVRWKPRVKHHDKKAIRSVAEITHEQYVVGLKTHDKDPFFRSHSKQEQNANCIGLENEIRYEEKPTPRRKRKHMRRHLLEEQRDIEWGKYRRSGTYE